MRTTPLSLGALLLGLASAWEYPDCDPDNCYREMTNDRFYGEAQEFCPQFLAGTTTAPEAIPTNFENCEQDVNRVSSACSCITYTATYTPGTTTGYPTETQTGYPTETETGYPTGTETETGYPTGTETETGYPTGTETETGYPTGTETETG
ncbi:hypothetical protein QBC33DRAFT_536620, partial [Phialemonium atrogriseum]